jgi:hypothetical protein
MTCGGCDDWWKGLDGDGAPKNSQLGRDEFGTCGKYVKNYRKHHRTATAYLTTHCGDPCTWQARTAFVKYLTEKASEFQPAASF